MTKLYLKAILGIALDSIAATTNCHELTCSEQHKFMTLEFCMSEVWHGSHEAKIQVWAGLASCLEALGVNSVALPFVAFVGCLHSLPLSTSLHFQSQQCQILGEHLSSDHNQHSFSNFKNSYNYVGWAHLGNPV